MTFFFQAEDGIRDLTVTGVQTCALPISPSIALSAGRHAERPHHLGGLRLHALRLEHGGGVIAGRGRARGLGPLRSEERRGGKEGRSRGSADHLKKKKKMIQRRAAAA